MPEISFDFREYMAARRGADDTRAQTGSAYVYPSDQKVLRTLARVAPVTLAVEATVRLWKSRGGRELLGSATKLGENEQPELYKNALLCAARLGMVLPDLYLVDELPGQIAYSFGTSDDASIVLKRALVEALPPEELRFIIGRECGHVQSGHTVYQTALYTLTTSANQFVRWIVTPAVLALRSWARRAAITADRAGLIGSGELVPSVAALLRHELGVPRLPAELGAEAYLTLVDKDTAGPAGLVALERSHPTMRARAAALRLFSETHFFLKASGRTPREDEGKSLAWCDERVKRLLRPLSKDDKTKVGD